MPEILCELIPWVTLTEEDVGLQFGAFSGLIGGKRVEGTVAHIGVTEGIAQTQQVPVRIHSSCTTGDVFYSRSCDCRWQLDHALHLIKSRGLGIIIYLAYQDGCGSGVVEKLRRSLLRNGENFFALPSDNRQYGLAAEVLIRLGVRSVELITNNPEKLAKLTEMGLHVKRTPSIMHPQSPLIREYLSYKANALGHFTNTENLP